MQVCWSCGILSPAARASGPFRGGAATMGNKHKIWLAILSSDHKHLLCEQPLLQWATYLTLWASVSSSVIQESQHSPQRAVTKIKWENLCKAQNTGQLALSLSGFGHGLLNRWYGVRNFKRLKMDPEETSRQRILEKKGSSSRSRAFPRMNEWTEVRHFSKRGIKPNAKL